MKSLILKDFYNLKQNMRSMGIVLVMYFIIFGQGKNLVSYISQMISMSCFLFMIMSISTFAYDDLAKWNRYALVTPVTKKMIVGGKYGVMMLLSVAGATAGAVLGFAGAVIFHDVPITMTIMKEVAMIYPVVVGVSFFYGSCMIPLMFQFGIEKARILTVACIGLIALLAVGGYQLLQKFEISLNEAVIKKGILGMVIVALLWIVVSYKITNIIFEKKEF